MASFKQGKGKSAVTFVTFTYMLITLNSLKSVSAKFFKINNNFFYKKPSKKRDKI